MSINPQGLHSLNSLGIHSDSTREGSVKTLINIILDPEAPNEPVSCSICLEQYSQKEVNGFSLSCQHGFCKKCIQEHIKTHIKDFKVLNIKCPQEGCGCTFTSRDLKQILEKDTYESYEKLALKKLSLSNPKHRLCPMPGCTFKLPSSKSLQVKCKCGSAICNTCGSRWHEGKTCLESIDAEFQLYSSEHEIKFCIVCKTTVKRIEGCKHITCPICDYEWCWDCGRQYTVTHSKACPTTWDPLPPKKIEAKTLKEKWLQSSLITKILIVILLLPFSPLLLVGLLFCWPVCFSFNPDDDLSWERPCQSLVVLIFSLILAVFFLPMIIMTVFIVTCLFILLLPFLVVYWIMECFNRTPKGTTRTVQADKIKVVENRWVHGDPQFFKYTSKGRPNSEVQTVPDDVLNHQHKIEQVAIEIPHYNGFVDLEKGDDGRQDV